MFRRVTGFHTLAFPFLPSGRDLRTSAAPVGRALPGGGRTLCAPKPRRKPRHRLQVARYLDEGEPYVEVQARTGASSTTVSRVSKALNGEYGGYRKILIKLEDGE